MPIRILRVAIMALAIAALPKAILANDSVYTDLDLDNCQTLAEDPMGVSLKCKGYRGEPVYFKEGDLRQSVFYGRVDQELIDGGFESFAAFNHINTKVEWRLGDDGNPLPQSCAGSSTIRGQMVARPGIPWRNPRRFRVGTADYGGSCMVALVDAKANPDANALARQMADDTASDFACGMQEPEWVGKRGDLVSDRTFSWPEGYVVE